MQEIRQDINALISQGSFQDEFIVWEWVMNAIYKLNTGKSDRNGGLSTENFKNSGDNLYVYLLFIFYSMLVHDAVHY